MIMSIFVRNDRSNANLFVDAWYLITIIVR